MNFFAHPGHEHAEVTAARASLDSSTIVILGVAAVAVIGIITALVIVGKAQQKKTAAK